MKKVFPLFLVLSILLFAASITQAQTRTVTRIYGESRFQTAAAISREGWDYADTVILTRSDDFPDALAGTPLAYQYNAPILLTTPGALNTATKIEIQRLQAQRIIILGSEGAVSTSVEQELISLGLDVQRIGGSDRYHTAQLIAEQLYSQSSTAVIAFGRNFPDALAVAPYAARNGYPILLTETNILPQATKEALQHVTHTIVVGGPAIISDTVMAELPVPTRIAGSDRFTTAAEIISRLYPPASKAYAATGLNFADALTGSALAAKYDAPIFLVRQQSLPLPARLLMNERDITNFTILGGLTAVSPTVENSLKGLKPESLQSFEKVVGFYALGGSWTNLFAKNYPVHGFGNTDIISELALGWYSLDSRGNILTNSGTGWQKPPGWQDVPATAALYNIKTDMVIHAEEKVHGITALLSNKSAMNRLVSEIVQEVQHFNGVNLNLEGLGLNKTGEELSAVQQSFTDFVRLLATELKFTGKKLTLTLHPPNSYYRGYDYKALGDLADYIIIMAYDYGVRPEPLWQVTQAVQMAAAVVPKEKLILGISIPSETPESIGDKVRVAREHGLGGIALWRLGLLSQEVWEALR